MGKCAIFIFVGVTVNVLGIVLYFSFFINPKSLNFDVNICTLLLHSTLPYIYSPVSLCSILIIVFTSKFSIVSNTGDCSADGTSCSIDCSGCSADGTGCSIDCSGCSADGTDCSADGTGCSIFVILSHTVSVVRFFRLNVGLSNGVSWLTLSICSVLNVPSLSLYCTISFSTISFFLILRTYSVFKLINSIPYFWILSKLFFILSTIVSILCNIFIFNINIPFPLFGDTIFNIFFILLIKSSIFILSGCLYTTTSNILSLFIKSFSNIFICI